MLKFRESINIILSFEIMIVANMKWKGYLHLAILSCRMMNMYNF